MTTTVQTLAMAVRHLQAGQLPEAERICRQVLAAYPNQADALHLLGIVASQMGQHEQAVEHITRAIALKGSDASFHSSLGVAFRSQGKLDEAVASFRRAVELKPDLAEAHNNLGGALHEQGKRDDAVNCFRRALQLRPGFVSAYNNLANTLLAQDKLEDAVAAYQRALELRPDFAKAHCNLGNALKQLRRFDEALASYERAVTLKPDYANAHTCRSLVRLLCGDYERGWTEYEWRWQTGMSVPRNFSQPEWDGSPLGQRTILLHDEQGFGDTIQFVRYVPLIKQQHPAATVVLECQRPLAKLIASCKGADRLVIRGDELPPFDVQAPLLSLPRILKTTVDTIPANVPYLSAERTLVDCWREQLAGVNGLRVGVNWHGRPGVGTFIKRNIPLSCFARLVEDQHTCLISLQKSEGPGELLAAKESGLPIVDLGSDFDKSHGPFMDTAAVMMNLDLVISSDTAVPHLAGALGVPVWLAVPFAPDWRWLMDRSDSPWYRTMRIFRQQQPGDWEAVFHEMATELRQFCSSKARENN